MRMKHFMSLLSILLLGCSTIAKKAIPKALEGKYVFINKKNNFYDELALRFNMDKNFFFNHRVGPETFEVKGTVRYIKKDVFELTVIDTITILRKEPIYKFYNVKDTLIVLSNSRIKLNGKKFTRIN